MSTSIEIDMSVDAIIARIMTDMEEVMGLIRRPAGDSSRQSRAATAGLIRITPDPVVATVLRDLPTDGGENAEPSS